MDPMGHVCVAASLGVMEGKMGKAVVQHCNDLIRGAAARGQCAAACLEGASIDKL